MNGLKLCVVLMLLLPLSAQEAGVQAVLEGLKQAPSGATAVPIRAGVTGFFVSGAGDAEGRPVVLVVAGLNSDHLLGVRVASALPLALQRLAATDASLREALERAAVLVVPAVEPERLAAAATAPLRDVRGNATPVDDDNDGLVDEDGPEDLDGDGIIATLRWPDPEGKLMASSEDPRLMVNADIAKSERGLWRIVSEGIDNDGDGLINEDGPGGVDLDRNFAHGWKESETSVGWSAPSEEPARALLKFVTERGNVAAVFVLGHRDNIATTTRKSDTAAGLAPNGLLAEDLPWANGLTEDLRRILGANDGAEDAPDGGFHHWAYGQHGVPAFASRVAYRPELPADAKLPSGSAPSSTEGRWLFLADQRQEGFLPWKKLSHPTLRDAELGGFVPRFAEKLASERFDALVEAQAKAVAALVTALPKLQVRTLSSKALGGGVHEVEAVLGTEGRLPLFTHMARRARATRSLRLEFAVQGGRILEGEKRQHVDDLGPNGMKKFRWLVHCPGPLDVRVTAGAPRTGTAEATLRVEGN